MARPGEMHYDLVAFFVAVDRGASDEGLKLGLGSFGDAHKTRILEVLEMGNCSVRD